ITVTSLRTRCALSVMSSRFPSGVATMYSVPVLIRRSLQLSVTPYPARLPRGWWDRLFLDELDLDADPELMGEALPDMFHHIPLPPHLIEKDGLAYLDQDGYLVEPPLPVDHDLVVRFRPLDFEEDGLDLGGEDVHPLDDQHVVGPPPDPGHPAQRSPAGAVPGQDARQAPRPVPEYR